MTITELQKEIHATANSKGWWDAPRNIGELIALCHAELSEALEEARSGAKLTEIDFTIDAAAKLKAEIVQTEIELGFLETNLRNDNQTLIALRNRLKELKKQYEKMQLGSQDYLLAFRDVPELGKELSDLLRDVKIQNEVYLLLQQQYYKEKIQENRDIPTVEILDEAIPPLRASSPRVFFSTIVGGIFIFLFLCLIVVVKEKKIIELQKVVKGK